MRPIRILQLVTKRQYRGAEVFAAELSSLLGEAGHQVVFAGLYPAPENELKAGNSRNVDLNGQKSAFSYSLLKSLAALMHEFQPDILQANGSDTLKYAVLAKKLYMPQVPVIYRNISMVSSWTGAGSLKTLFNRMLFRQVSFVTSVGRESLDDLVKTYQFPADKTRVIRRGIPDLSFNRNAARQALAEEMGFSSEDPVVVHIGQFSDEKNHPFLIEAFSKLLERMPQARLILVGEGKNHSAIRRQLMQQKPDGHIFLAGHRSPVQEILAGADLFVLGSTIEGVPGVILEAAMQSIPCVAVKVGGVGEVVISGETGILLEKHDPEAFAGAMEDLLTDTHKRNMLGRQARAFALEHYSLQGCLRNFEKLYEQVLTAAAR